MSIRFGADVLLHNASAFLANRNYAFLTNQSSVDGKGDMVLHSLLARGLPPRLIFAPEHGLYGVEQDMIPVDECRDPITGIPIVSLYGSQKEHLHPLPEHFAGIDLLLVDLQDIGTRYYTFIYTMAFCLRVCAALGIEVVVCDRPNPLGGLRCEGAEVTEKFKSFVGAYSIPVRHSLTIGEFAKFVLLSDNLDLNLQVLAVQNYSAATPYADCRNFWVPPSPNMPQISTAVVYPGMCLLEATNLSEGRGTTRPFEIFGAPWIKSAELCRHLNELRLPGVFFRPVLFRPAFQKHAGNLCEGAFLHITNENTFEPYKTGLMLLAVLQRLYPEHFGWRSEPYEYEIEIPAIDMLTGSNRFREKINEIISLEDLNEFLPVSNEFTSLREELRMYPL
ncbi:MAG: DUF1343 domain-containing protein [Leptospiraceae bacterium]|nr:DUF1343 domain-containing protein [Leptospiraceae bacterium]